MGLGWMEIGAILVVAIIVFGPDRLPGLAKQAAQFIRTLRQMAENAKSELGKELGDDFKDLNLRDLDPRAAVRDVILSDRTTPPPAPSVRILRPGEVPPFDAEAT
ncbi:sec-independent translocase [Aeromicrobium choanae]|uniref:Sec-independent protein translocase protein TatB n=1 Tax=Aeromicrobium choanae TaxID=1736691 RepID=A0A1T4Z450_9ACTN|nr:sec-independent translocase [Aeromicrobium choanae]SKB08774.1 sec-independent protein translocase protein TatB [Aeromicrobium choanae]